MDLIQNCAQPLQTMWMLNFVFEFQLHVCKDELLYGYKLEGLYFCAEEACDCMVTLPELDWTIE